MGSALTHTDLGVGRSHPIAMDDHYRYLISALVGATLGIWAAIWVDLWRWTRIRKK